LPISAREMTGAERRYFHEQKKEGRSHSRRIHQL
jgi:hypothetical protein